jgi:hypothetical protein
VIKEVKRLSLYKAALATLAYADVFDFPLTRQEFHEWALFFSSPMNIVDKKTGFLFLKNRSNLVGIRKERTLFQKEKWVIAQRAARWLALFPTVQLVGVTGGLAMNNAKREDDIDLFLVVAGGTIWITRLLVTIFMDLLRLRRKPYATTVTNKVCLNMFVTTRGLRVPSGERDCFSAHEVLQMKPLWEQKGTYRKFLKENEWSGDYLPNAWKERGRENVPTVCQTPALVVWAFRIFEFPAKLVQLIYMQRHRSHEVVTDSVLRFHPKDARVWVKRKFAERLKKLKIPLDKVFYAS